MNNVLFLLTLGKVSGIGRKTLKEIQAEEIAAAVSIGDIYDVLLRLAGRFKRITKASKQEISAYYDEAQRILAANDKLGIMTIDKASEYYPAGFRQLADEPLYFFAKGNAACLKTKGIAVIGTRKASAAGYQNGESCGEILAEHGICVVSGLAQGCDTAGHTGCLKRGGTSIAVSATALDVFYPKKSEKLVEQILAQNGCMISEYPLGNVKTNRNFLERDRLQAGVAAGVIVVEAGERSGTMHAVNGTIELGKPVGCLAYDEEHYKKVKEAQGNKLLIEQGKAEALPDAESINNFIRKI